LPIYEYRCQKGHQYERWESFGAPPEQSCPHCGGPSRRLLSLPAVIFKGPGFYSTDKRKDGQRHEEREASSKASTSGESSD